MARIKFAIDPEALQEDAPVSSQESEFLRARIDLLLAFWNSFGTWVEPEQIYKILSDGSLAWDNDLLQTMKTALRPFVTGGARRSADLVIQLQDEEGPLPILWEDIRDSESMGLWLPDFDLALVGQRIANHIGLANQSCIHCPSSTSRFVDVALWLRGVAQSCQHQELVSIDATRTINQGKLVIDLWDETFQPIAKRAREVVIIDRYAAVRTLNYSDRSGGLYRLIDLIDGNSNIRKITVYSAYNVARGIGQRPPALGDLKNSLRNKLGQSNFQNVESVNLYLAANDHFREEGRDRFLRFDSIACAIGHGLDVFEGQNVQVGTTFGLLSQPEDKRYVRDLERRLNRETSPQDIIQLPLP